MSTADRLAGEYEQHLPGGHHAARHDPVYTYQVQLLRDLMHRAEVIMTDEDVEPFVRERVLRGLLYGWPLPADAEQRIRDRQETARRAAWTAGQPLLSPGGPRVG